MAKIEVDEAEYATARALATFVQNGMANQATRQQLLQVQKTLNPNIAIPEIDAAAPLRSEIQTLAERIDKRFQEEDERRAKAETEANNNRHRSEWQRTQATARQSGYNTDEALNALEKFMADNGIVNHEIAIPAYEVRNPPPPPVTASNRWNFADPNALKADETMKLLMENPFGDEFLRVAVPAALADARQGR